MIKRTKTVLAYTVLHTDPCGVSESASVKIYMLDNQYILALQSCCNHDKIVVTEGVFKSLSQGLIPENFEV